MGKGFCDSGYGANMLMGMGMVAPREVWRTALYLRLSHEDGDGEESNSIASQRAIIREYVDRMPDVRVVGEYVDDGWSGSTFDRPAFKRMMKAVEAGKADCILVKDLSRFGRNYIETGRYLERELPSRGVRVIAVADGYDSLQVQDMSSQLLVPFKNLMNDYYCATTSAKVKAALAVRRREGIWVGAKVPFGYVKDKKDRGRLVVDPEAAKVVRLIFSWRAEAIGFGEIARRLNETGVPCPSEYRMMRTKNGIHPNEGDEADARRRFDGEGAHIVEEDIGELLSGLSYDASWKEGNETISGQPHWHAREVQRITENPCYRGTLAQGRTYSPSFRSRKRLNLDKRYWVCVEGGCPAIVTENVYDLVSHVNVERTSARGKVGAHPLSGLVTCGLCGARARYSYCIVGGKRYGYYRLCCSCGGKGRRCWHSHRDDDLLEYVCNQVGCAPDRSDIVRAISCVELHPGKDPVVVKRVFDLHVAKVGVFR